MVNWLININLSSEDWQRYDPNEILLKDSRDEDDDEDMN